MQLGGQLHYTLYPWHPNISLLWIESIRLIKAAKLVYHKIIFMPILLHNKSIKSTIFIMIKYNIWLFNIKHTNVTLVKYKIEALMKRGLLCAILYKNHTSLYRNWLHLYNV